MVSSDCRRRWFLDKKNLHIELMEFEVVGGVDGDGDDIDKKK